MPSTPPPGNSPWPTPKPQITGYGPGGPIYRGRSSLAPSGPYYLTREEAIQEQRREIATAAWFSEQERKRQAEKKYAPQSSPVKVPSKPTLPLRLESKVMFFESDYYGTPNDWRRDIVTYAQSTTCYMNFEIKLRNQDWQCDQTYRAEWRYYYPNGRLMEGMPRVDDFVVKSYKLDYWFSRRWGWSTPGRWSLGTYRVEILIDGVKFAEGSFYIV